MVNTVIPKPTPAKLCWIHMSYTEGQLPLISCNQLTGTVTKKVCGRVLILYKNHGQHLEEFSLPGPTLCGVDVLTPLGSICPNSWEFPLPHSSVTSPDPQVSLGKRCPVEWLPDSCSALPGPSIPRARSGSVEETECQQWSRQFRDAQGTLHTHCPMFPVDRSVPLRACCDRRVSRMPISSKKGRCQVGNELGAEQRPHTLC